jgi:hypothetical protein
MQGSLLLAAGSRENIQGSTLFTHGSRENVQGSTLFTHASRENVQGKVFRPEIACLLPGRKTNQLKPGLNSCCLISYVKHNLTGQIWSGS